MTPGTLRGLARLVRPANAATSAAAALVGALLAADAALAPRAWLAVVGAALASFAFAAAGNVRNDLGDVDVDRRAHPGRPLVTGAVPVGLARGAAWALYAVALVGGALVSWLGLVLVALALPVMEGYERWGKRAGFPGNLLIGLLTAAPFVLGAMATGGPDAAVLAVALLAALATVGREVLKDVEDVEADRGARRTLPMRVGARRAALVAAAFLGATVLLSGAPFLLETSLGWAYLPAVGVADACFLAASAVGHRDAGRAQRLAKAGMVAALVALLVGRAHAWGGAWS